MLNISVAGFYLFSHLASDVSVVTQLHYVICICELLYHQNNNNNNVYYYMYHY